MTRRALVIVLGDLDRSPRMRRHAASLITAGWTVDTVAFGDATRKVPAFDWLRSKRAFWFVAPLRQVALAASLCLVLATVRRPDAILLANPPAFPALPVVLLFNAVWRARLIIDWHNLTAAMLRLRSDNPLAMHIVDRIERLFARRAHAHVSVSLALAAHLPFPATVVPDRPSGDCVAAEINRDGPPVVIVPTSWSLDEDMDLAFDAATICDEGLPSPLVFLITGRGERRPQFERRVAQRKLRRVRIETRWFPHHDYLHAVATSALGLSLHRSASGLDIPFKITEMIGCGIPVCAFDYAPVVREILEPGVNGCLFHDANELAAILSDFFATWPATPKLDALRATTRGRPMIDWEEQWTRSVLPLLS